MVLSGEHCEDHYFASDPIIEAREVVVREVGVVLAIRVIAPYPEFVVKEECNERG